MAQLPKGGLVRGHDKRCAIYFPGGMNFSGVYFGWKKTNQWRSVQPLRTWTNPWAIIWTVSKRKGSSSRPCIFQDMLYVRFRGSTISWDILRYSLDLWFRFMSKLSNLPGRLFSKSFLTQNGIYSPFYLHEDRYLSNIPAILALKKGPLFCFWGNIGELNAGIAINHEIRIPIKVNNQNFNQTLNPIK